MFSRRSFLASLGAGLGTGLGVGLGLPSVAAPAGPRKNLVIVYAFGGWDTSLVLDPKPDSPAVAVPDGTVGLYGNLDVYETPATGAVSTYFQRHGAESAIVRGVDMLSLSHAICRRNVLTGRSDYDSPDIAAIVAHTHGPDLALPYLMLSDRGMAGPLAGLGGRVGTRNQMGTLLSPELAFPPLDQLTPQSTDEKAAIRAWLERRSAAQASQFTSERGARLRADFEAALGRVDRIREQSDIFAEGGEVLSLDEQVLLAVDALERGMTQAVTMDTGFNWDTHYLINLQNSFFNRTFSSLTLLVERLKAAPGRGPGQTLFDETLVMVISEMGRTAGLNEDEGKEHNPYTSLMLVGGGVKGGQAFGGTDDWLQGLPVDRATGQVSDAGTIVEPGQLAAGVLQACGVDASSWLVNVDPYMAPYDV